MKQFTVHMKKQDPGYPMSGKTGSIARKALEIAKFRPELRREQIPGAGGPYTWGQFIEHYRIDQYIRQSGDGPEGLKDLLSF